MTINSWGSTDPVEVSKGGTGLTTLTDNNVLIGKGTSALEFLSLSKGDLLVGDGVTNPGCKRKFLQRSKSGGCYKILHEQWKPDFRDY